MGTRESTFRRFLTNIDSPIDTQAVAIPKLADVLNSPFKDEVQRIYHSLGGVLPTFPLNLRKWDINTNGIAVELDEELHFNRYRGLTLESNIYNMLDTFPLSNYKNYCKSYEYACLKAGKYGGKWTNASCEKQFGEASPKGELSNNGSPRWKQRAFYDYVKDISPLIIGVKVVRIAIWDKVKFDGEMISVSKIFLMSLNK